MLLLNLEHNGRSLDNEEYKYHNYFTVCFPGSFPKYLQENE